MKKNLKDTLVIACGVFRTDLEAIIAAGVFDLDIHYLPGGLHSEPRRLRSELQAAIEKAEGTYRRIVLLYGLCGRGVVGIRSGSCTLVVPKVHDCISLFLGGAAEYRRQFAHSPGTYYISAGWYREQVQPIGKTRGIVYPEAYVDTSDPGELAKKYGTENAGEITGFLNSWKKRYNRAVYIDTGSQNEAEYENHARSLAEENGWEFVRLTGSHALILRCLNQFKDDPEVLIVPPGHELIQDAVNGTVASAPLGGSSSLKRDETLVLKVKNPEPPEAPGSAKSPEPPAAPRVHTVGLGIDAGGTYTDAVIYDFRTKTVIAKSKALTTKWKYSSGIMSAINALPEKALSDVDIVAVSTTLVTNAIVESKGRNVGLLLMPDGLELPDDLHHQPVSLITGRMTIGGEIIQDIDEEEIRRVAREFVRRYHVEAFAVSGYGGAVNPELEIRVKGILRDETDMDVCCGHELSGSLNFTIRATTSVLNAGVMPIMEEFLEEMEIALAEIGINAPLLVVRGDGSVMRETFAKEFPVQTALSGPAASMAGARYLTGLPDALVVDIGGTTSDIGFLENGNVSVCDEGATIGGWATHIKAVDMRTAGLGGDSEILFERGEWKLGPRRVAPVSWLGSTVTGRFPASSASPASPALPASPAPPTLFDRLEKAAIHFTGGVDSTVPFQFLIRTGKEPDFPVTEREGDIMDALAGGPLMISELQVALGQGSWRTIKTARLESGYCLQRCGLTPTDLYHAGGLLTLWDAGFAGKYVDFIAHTCGIETAALHKIAENLVDRVLGRAILEKIMPGGGGKGEEQELRDSILEGGNRIFALRPAIRIPVVGLGAPARLMMGGVMRRLGGEWKVPDDGDVANAIGAVTSEVKVVRNAAISSTSAGGYRIAGVEGCSRHFETLEEAEEVCMEELALSVRDHALRAGTSSTEVRMKITTETARSAEGSELFIQRNFSAEITGPPDRA